MTTPNARLDLLTSRDRGPWQLHGPPWAAAVTFVSHGAVIGVRSTDAAVLERIAENPPTAARPCTALTADAVYSWTVERPRSAAPVHVVSMRCRRYPKGKEIDRTADLEVALATLKHDAEFRVAMYAPDDVFIHAAVVAWHGRAILIPGQSFSGKSTLAAELVRRGAPYYSDEYAVLDTDGRVRPFARRLMLRSEHGHRAGRPSAEELGGTRGTEPLPIGAVIVTRYMRDAQWDPRPLTRGEMVLALLEHAIDVRARPAHVLVRIAHSVGTTAIGLKGDRGHVAVSADEILERAAWS